MKNKTIAAILSLVLTLSGCSNMSSTHTGASSGNDSSYCSADQHEAVCVAGGILIAGLAAGILLNKSGDGGGGCGNCNVHRK